MRDIKAKRLDNDINENRNDPKRIHQIINNAMYIYDNKPLPPEQTGIDLAEEFINYYHNKIKDICTTLEEEDKTRNIFIPLFRTELNNFNELTQEEVKEMFFKALINSVNWILCLHG